MVAQYTIIDNQVYYELHYTGRTLLTRTVFLFSHDFLIVLFEK